MRPGYRPKRDFSGCVWAFVTIFAIAVAAGLILAYGERWL